MEHCAFSEAIRLLQSVGCVGNKLQFRTVQQNQKSFLWTQDWDWMVCLLWNYGIWSSQFFTESRIRMIKYGDPSRSPTRKKIHGKIGDLDNVDFISPNVNSSRKEALLFFFENNEAVIKMIIKGRSPTMRHVWRTHRVAQLLLIGRLVLSIGTSRSNQIHWWHQEPTRGRIDKGKFHTWWLESSLCLFNISHFSSINSVKAMSNRTLEDAGEERVTA